MEINLQKISAIHKLFRVLFAIHLLSGFCGYQWNIVFYFGAFCQRVALFYIIILHAGFILFPDICNRDVFFFCVSHRNLFINATRAAIFWGEFISASKNTRVESVVCVVAWWWYLCAVMFLAGTRRERACYSCSWPEGRLKINTRIFSACSTTTTRREYFCFVSKYLRFSVYIMPVFNITLVFFTRGICRACFWNKSTFICSPVNMCVGVCVGWSTARHSTMRHSTDEGTRVPILPIWHKFSIQHCLEWPAPSRPLALPTHKHTQSWQLLLAAVFNWLSSSFDEKISWRFFFFFSFCVLKARRIVVWRSRLMARFSCVRFPWEINQLRQT